VFKHKFHILLLLLASLIFPQVALAESSYNAENLVPTTDNGPYLSTHSARLLRQYKWTVGSTLDLAHRPVELIGPSGGRISGVLEDLFMMHILGAVGITDWVQIGMDIPLALVSRTINTVTGFDSSDFRMSDIHLEAKFRLLDPDNAEYHGWGIAAIPFIDFPTGSGEHLVGNDTFAGGAKVAFESPNIGNIARIALNVGFQLRESTDLFGTEVDDWFLYSMAVNFRVADYFEVVPEIFGKTLIGDFFERESQSPLELGGVIRIMLMDNQLALDFGGSGGLVSGIGTPVWRSIFRVAYSPLRRSLRAQTGEIPVPIGLSPEDYYRLSKECPPNPEDFDSDKHDEACEKVYELRALYGECPPPEEFDEAIHDQACEKIFELQGFDVDGDGVPDYLDHCPDEPGPVENDGCPTYGMAYIDWEEGRVKSDKLLFDFSRAEVTDQSRNTLFKIAELLKSEFDKMSLIYIEGHTDNVGSLEFNNTLSIRRAQAVKNILQEYGLPVDKVRVVGYGRSRPAVGNDVLTLIAEKLIACSAIAAFVFGFIKTLICG
jgi:outer membrane protein OmpA-like peptidoglycan-associated protein